MLNMLLNKNRALDDIFVRWNWMRAVLHNGWWLVTSLYLAVNGQLTASQLVYIGVFQGATSFIFEVPAGVIADTFSRKWSLVISQILMGLSMIITGLVTDFPLLVMAQMLWGISWTFASGADIAYITDELNQSEKIDGVLTRTARAQLWGAAFGIISVGLLAWSTTLSTAMIISGLLMMLLGAHIAFAFHEKRFIRIRHQRWLASWNIFRDGVSLVRKSTVILVVFAATFLVDGASEISRLFPKKLVELGFPAEIEPIAWLTALSLITLIIGIPVLKIVEARVQNINTARLDYVFAGIAGILGLVVLALTPNTVVGSAGILLFSGIATPLTRTLASIQVNRATTDSVRATVHSFLAQAEYLGEILCGFSIGLIAKATGLKGALIASALLMGAASITMSLKHPDRASRKISKL